MGMSNIVNPLLETNSYVYCCLMKTDDEISRDISVSLATEMLHSKKRTLP